MTTNALHAHVRLASASKPHYRRFVFTRLFFLAALAAASNPAYAQPAINTVIGGAIPTGVPAQNVALYDVSGIAADAKGNLVVTEWPRSVIRRIRPDGIVETIAGTGENSYSGDGGEALKAVINWPVTPRFDSQGNLYFGEAGNLRIRRIDTNGIMSTVVGDGVAPTTGMDVEGPALQRSVWGSSGLTVSPAGILYFTQGPFFVLRLNPDGSIQRIAGIEHYFCASCTSGDGGPALQAQLAGPGPISVDAAGNVYVVDAGSRIRKITPDGAINAVAGFGTSGALRPTAHQR